MSKRSSLLPDSYNDFLQVLKEQIRAAQVRASLAVNRELILLYWQMGREILARQQQEGWGAKVIEKLSTDLRREFPELNHYALKVHRFLQG